ncbi:EcsC family protein [Streptococcus sanguinis]|uniref:EcsC family protein n=1 Tax=Streptococcus sanguinis TaxID=1305 RepID=UPI002284BE00|nr:EcsC family protein [Streptococcus sanguinis]MCY7040780.1 EcsC family protein [Streptococcus sanguinis]
MKLELPKSKLKMPNIDEKSMLKVLDWTYETTINGIPGQKTIEELAADYLKHDDIETAISKMITYQTSKAGISGFVTGFGGILTMPVTIPANITSVILVQMRMIATIAYMRGYDLKSDQVQTFVYASLTGTSVADIAKKAGIIIANKMATGVIKKIPGKVLTKINQAVGFRLVTKFGTKGAVNLGKMVPIAGALIGGVVDTASTQIIAKNALKTFTPKGINIGDGTIIDIK